MQKIFIYVFMLFLPFSLHAEVKCPKGTELLETTEDEYKIIWCSSHGDASDLAANNFFEMQLKNVHKNVNGPLELYDSAGNQLLRAHYREGRLHGAFSRNFSNGNKQTTGQYKNGFATGEWIRYYENGQIRDKGLMSNGKPSGKWVFFKQDGSVERQKSFDINLQDRLWRIRVGAFEVKPSDRNNCYGNCSKTEVFLGLDRRLWTYQDWFRLRGLAELSSFRFSNQQYNGPGPYPSAQENDRTWALMTTANFEFIPSFFPHLTASLRLGTVLLDQEGDKNSETEQSLGVEFRYYFSKAYFMGLDSFFLSAGKIGKGEDDADTMQMGLQFAL